MYGFMSSAQPSSTKEAFTQLCEALQNGHDFMVEHLLNRFDELYSYEDPEKETILSQAALHGTSLKVFNLMLKFQKNLLDQPNSADHKPIDICKAHKREAFVKAIAACYIEQRELPSKTPSVGR